MLIEKNRQKRKELAKHQEEMYSNTIMVEENHVETTKQEAVAQ